jgi:hypothetical protein
VRARDRYRLIVRKGGLGPAWLAGPERMDHIEVVGLDDGEVVFLWDLTPKVARRLVRALREDLGTLDADQIRAEWADADGRSAG